MSQLDLAVRSGYSPKHVSFIETGRTRPTREALLVLAETLDVPLRERNRILEAGGYANVYGETPMAADEMSHVRGVLQFILDRHMPYAAVVLNRHGDCLMGNTGSARLLATLADPSLLGEGTNYLRALFHPLGARRWIVNWEEVAEHVLARARRELGSAAGGTGAALLREVQGYVGAPVGERHHAVVRPADLLLPIHIRKNDIELRLFSTMMTLGTPRDVTLQELTLEAFFPADSASERAWATLVTG